MHYTYYLIKKTYQKRAKTCDYDGSSWKRGGKNVFEDF